MDIFHILMWEFFLVGLLIVVPLAGMGVIDWMEEGLGYPEEERTFAAFLSF